MSGDEDSRALRSKTLCGYFRFLVEGAWLCITWDAAMALGELGRWEQHEVFSLGSAIPTLQDSLISV